MAIIDLNNENIVAFTAKLERLNRSAFPSAVRNTLNQAAFETKKELPGVAATKFITREKSFFRRFSLVEKAKGWDVNSMKAIAGINAAIDKELAINLEAQEFGGLVRGKKLIPHDEARTSKSQLKKVSRKNYLNRVHIHDATKAFKAHRGTRGSKFIAAVMSTVKRGKKHMLLKTGQKGMVYEVTGVSQNIKNKTFKFKIKKLYSVRNNKTHRVQGQRFVTKSSSIAAQQMPRFYKKQAEFQFKKALK